MLLTVAVFILNTSALRPVPPDPWDHFGPRAHHRGFKTYQPSLDVIEALQLGTSFQAVDGGRPPVKTKGTHR